MDAATYDQWYETPRGRWIGQHEAALVLKHLQPKPAESLLDVGCGTGFFTRAFAASVGGPVTGVDINPDWIEYARKHDHGRATYENADACALPYPNASFDLAVSIAALCFIDNEVTAICEILRVTRRRFAIGLLNQQSLLWLQKGRGNKQGSYRGAHWHSVREVRSLFRDLPVQQLRVLTAIQIPSGGPIARTFERLWPSSLPFGAFLLVVGDVV